MTREVDKVRDEKDRKIDELNSLLKSQSQSQRDNIAKIRGDNEVLVRK